MLKLRKESAMPLPEGLSKRLRNIPREEFLCRDLDGRWAEWSAGELRASEVQQIEDHLAACDRCRSVSTALGGALLQPVPLPAHLRAQLLRIPVPRRRAPWWLSDVRFALAASYLLALCVTFGASAAGRAPAVGEVSGEALVRSVAAVGGEVNGRVRQAVAASGRFGSELQRATEGLFTSSSNRNPDEMTPAEDPRPSNEERR